MLYRVKSRWPNTSINFFFYFETARFSIPIYLTVWYAGISRHSCNYTRETTVSFYPSKRKLKIEWRCEFFRQILSFLTTISILESNIFIRGTVIVEEEREKEDIYIYIRTSNKYLLFRRYIIFASFRSHGVNNKFHAVSNIFSGSLKGCKINGQRKGKRELLVSAWREREREGRRRESQKRKVFHQCISLPSRKIRVFVSR